MPGKFYITTAIDYPNNRPHIGHAFEKIGADVQTRYRRMQGYDTHFLIGNDENTVKVSKRAAELGRDTQSYVNEMAGHFKTAWRQLNISNDDFIQTSEARHHAGCREFMQRVFDAGYIYRKAYTALYCEGCESFKTPKDLEDGRCPNHVGSPLRTLEEENYFFALSRFRDRLLELYSREPDFIQPATRRNEIVSLVEREGLEDISITRQNLDWGIPTPFDPSQSIYVWFDALLNYITGVGYGSDASMFRKWWPADMHVIGKDITRFHCALWPAMLMAADLPLPGRVQVHGFVLLRGEKMSKSLGNVVDPMDLYERFGSDAFRYFFMRECPFTGDGDFSYERFAAVYDSDLANNIGNLFSRTITMCLKYFDGHIQGNAGCTRAHYGDVDIASVVAAVQAKVEACEYNLALGTIWQQVLDPANRVIDRTKPWELATRDRAACERVLLGLAETLRVASILIRPFLPTAAEKIHAGFDYAAPFDSLRFEDAAKAPADSIDLRVTATLVDGKVPQLFPRLPSPGKAQK